MGYTWEEATEELKGEGFILELGSLSKGGVSSSPALGFFCHSGIRSALAGVDPSQLASFCNAPAPAPKAGMFAGRWCWEVDGDPPPGPCLSPSHGAVSLLQEMAQINEDNLTAYNRCALFALGAAYLNLISQLITVPTFCQHIHEVRRARADALSAAAPLAPARFELGSLLAFCRSSRCGRRRLPICSLRMCSWRGPGESLLWEHPLPC